MTEPSHPTDLSDAVYHVLRDGLAWRLLPERFPPWPSV
jgi:transposase